MKIHHCTCINRRLGASLDSLSCTLIILSWICVRRERRTKLLARIFVLGFGIVLFLGFISHGEIFVLALYFVDEFILKKFVGFYSP